MIARVRIVALLPVISLLCLACTAWGQSTGAITGHVKSKFGYGLWKASVTVTPGAISVYSGISGAYTISGLAPGIYTITAGLLGFVPSTSGSITVTAGRTAVCPDLVLQEDVSGWPLSPPGSGLQDHVMATFGDWGQTQDKSTSECTWMIHHGLDLWNGASPAVHAVRAGLVYIDDSDPRGECYWSVVVERKDGNEKYGHVAPADLDEGEDVPKGHILGTLVTWPVPLDPVLDHLHLAVFRWNGGYINPLMILRDPLPQFTEPSVSQLWIVRDPDLPAPEPDPHYSRVWYPGPWMNHLVPALGGVPLIRDRVDIVAEVSSSIGCWDVGIYRLEYQITGDEAATQSHVFTRTFLKLDSLGTSDNVGPQTHDGCWANVIFAGGTKYRESPKYYTVTNSIDDWADDYANIAENCWNTTHYHDGKYRIDVNAWDYRRATNPNQPPATASIPVIVDNTCVAVDGPLKL